MEWPLRGDARTCSSIRCASTKMTSSSKGKSVFLSWISQLNLMCSSCQSESCCDEPCVPMVGGDLVSSEIKKTLFCCSASTNQIPVQIEREENPCVFLAGNYPISLMCSSCQSESCCDEPCVPMVHRDLVLSEINKTLFCCSASTCQTSAQISERETPMLCFYVTTDVCCLTEDGWTCPYTHFKPSRVKSLAERKKTCAFLSWRSSLSLMCSSCQSESCCDEPCAPMVCRDFVSSEIKKTLFCCSASTRQAHELIAGRKSLTFCVHLRVNTCSLDNGCLG